ncbi:MAG TPA: single-stranded-DNA-specific exonuclease RecJ [Burkholderiaceae bacterium]|nr:single-stranded-DNA-specific exonuclease RecJ [Burkholderiaceae bacterium]HQR69124.1 single-stranded-DNA-specific exonuclease RecJ [Burkholderiaceae bacterium]
MTRLITRDFDPAVARRLAASGMPAALARVLAARGVTGDDELRLALDGLFPPGALAHVDAAASLLADAIEADARLLIVADYDCDGATACAVGLRGLRALAEGTQATVDYLVPNRFEYGYGLTPEIVDLAALRSPDLLITVDNGIASVEGVARANELGIEVLITDHHLPGAVLPAAACIVNPNQPGCGFPSKNLAGVGVMFYVLLALRAELRARGRFDAASQPRLDALLDLVALGTVADVVRLDHNNRVLVAQGLQRIRSGRLHAGIAALFQVAGRDVRSAGAADLGFAIGPRINAAGRLTDMTVGIECLTTDSFERGLALAHQLDELNRERREIEGDMQFDALAALDAASVQQRSTICLFDETWHQGVVGLVASRIKDRFHRPTIAFARSGESELRGSGRSIEGVHLRDTLDLVTKIAPQMIRRFGGHAMAAGLTLNAGDFGSFVAAFEDATRSSCDRSIFERTIATDGALEPSEFTFALVEAIGQHVWGQGFPPPLFAQEFDVLEQRLVKDRHLKLALELDGRRFNAIWFRRTEPLPRRARLAYRPAIDDFQGQRRLTLHIESCESSG